MLHIAIIDDGINFENAGICLENNIFIKDDLSVNQLEYQLPDTTHGTVCAAIINQNIDFDVKFSSVKILDTNKANSDKLIKAINWCVEAHVDVVNMSLGSTSQFDYAKIKSAVNLAYEKGLIIIAAGSNEGLATFPASLSNVIGVKADRASILSKNEWTTNENRIDGIEFIAFSKHTVHLKNGDKTIKNAHNSFAAPLITSNVIKIINSAPNVQCDKIEYIKNELSIMGKSNQPFLSVYYKADWIEESATLTAGNARMPMDGCFLGFDDLYARLCAYDFKQTVLVDFRETLNDNQSSQIVNMLNKVHARVIVCDDDNLYVNNLLAKSLVKKWCVYDKAPPKCAKDNKIPVISIKCIKGVEWIAGCIIKNLRELFEQDGYFAYVFSDKALSVLEYGEAYLKPLDNDFINSVAAIKNADLCIIYSRQESDADIVIRVREYGVMHIMYDDCMNIVCSVPEAYEKLTELLMQ